MSPVTRSAPAADQRRLLEVQALDTQLAQVAHRARTLPEHAAIAALDGREREHRDNLVVARTAASDVGREALRAETEVEQVRARAARTSERLAAGSGSPRELQQLLAEAEALTRRLGTLEDSLLEVMERQEAADAAVADAEARAGSVEADRARLVTAREEALAAARAERQRVGDQRAVAVASLDHGLVALYEAVRSRRDGLGAALLAGTACGGCRMPLTGTFRARVSAAAPDDVVQCEECDRIVVRAGEPELRR